MALPLEDQFNFAAFEPVERRKAREKEEQKTQLRKYTQTAEDIQQAAQDRKKAAQSAFKVIATSVVLFGLFFANLKLYSMSDMADREYSALNEKYSMVVSNNQKLSMELNSMISIEQVEKTAVEELGLVKLDQSQIEYVKTSAGNRVVVGADASEN